MSNRALKQTKWGQCRADDYTFYRDLGRDTSKARFSCVGAARGSGEKETTLWHGQLPNGEDIFVLSINRPYGAPAYDRGFNCRNEAFGKFGDFLPTGGEA